MEPLIFIEPPIFTSPPIPAPPLTINAPFVVVVDGVLLFVAINPSETTDPPTNKDLRIPAPPRICTDPLFLLRDSIVLFTTMELASNILLTNKFSPIPTPPFTTRAPVEVV